MAEQYELFLSTIYSVKSSGKDWIQEGGVHGDMPYWLHTTVSTKGVAPGTKIYWKIEGENIDEYDFQGPAFKFPKDVNDTRMLNGYGYLDDSGEYLFTHTPASDMKTEGDEEFTIYISDSPSFSKILAKETGTIKDTSQDESSMRILFRGGKNIYREGEVVRGEITYSGRDMDRGAEVFWDISGPNIGGDDFERGFRSGSVYLERLGWSDNKIEVPQREGDEQVI